MVKYHWISIKQNEKNQVVEKERKVYVYPKYIMSQQQQQQEKQNKKKPHINKKATLR